MSKSGLAVAQRDRELLAFILVGLAKISTAHQSIFETTWVPIAKLHDITKFSIDSSRLEACQSTPHSFETFTPKLTSKYG
jgi:hypothetical protein